MMFKTITIPDDYKSEYKIRKIMVSSGIEEDMDRILKIEEENKKEAMERSAIKKLYSEAEVKEIVDIMDKEIENLNSGVDLVLGYNTDSIAEGVFLGKYAGTRFRMSPLTLLEKIAENDIEVEVFFDEEGLPSITTSIQDYIGKISSCEWSSPNDIMDLDADLGTFHESVDSFCSENGISSNDFISKLMQFDGPNKIKLAGQTLFVNDMYNKYKDISSRCENLSKTRILLSVKVKHIE